MDLEYLRDRIHEELNDACAYAKMGIELKAMSTDWSKSFMNMSAEELKHANEIYRLYGDYLNRLNGSYENKPKYVEEIDKDVREFYPEMVLKVKALHDIYR